MIPHLLALFLVTSTAAAADNLLLKDDFSQAEKEGRRAMRGAWSYADGVATCTQDDELYKKFKDHGPIIFYDLDYTDGKVSFQFKAQDCKTVVFTCNNKDGHIFRFVSSATGTSVRAFPPKGDVKSIQIAKGPALTQGTWVPVTVELRGSKAIVQIGSAEPMTVEHPSFAVAKSNLSIGFSFGTLSVRDVLVSQ